MRVTNQRNGAVLVEKGSVAKTTMQRFIGLMRHKSLAPGDGLWFPRCNNIHSFHMKFLFDAAFLDKDHKLVYAIHEMKPWRIAPIVFKASSVLELPGGVLKGTGTELGDVLVFEGT